MKKRLLTESIAERMGGFVEALNSIDEIALKAFEKAEEAKIINETKKEQSELR